MSEYALIRNDLEGVSGGLLRGLKGKKGQAFRSYWLWEIRRRLLVMIYGSESLLMGLW